MAADHSIIAKVGRVTGRVAPGQVGEVMIPIRGASEAFYAYAAEDGDVLDVGTRVLVIDFEEPRTVRVSRF